MVAVQISRDPLVRCCMRETFFDRAKLDIVPTKRGIKEIDENHPCYRSVDCKPFVQIIKENAGEQREHK